METYFDALGIVLIFDVSLLANLPKKFHFIFEQKLSVALIKSKTLFLLPGAFIAQYIIIPYKDDSTDIKYVDK